MTVRDKVVVVAPPATGSGESGSELYSLDTRYGKNQVSSGTFYRIEERFTRSGGDALCPDFDDSAGRIAGQAQVVQDSFETAAVGHAVDFGEPCGEPDTREQLFGCGSGCDQCDGHPAGEHASASGMIEAAVFAESDEVGM